MDSAASRVTRLRRLADRGVLSALASPTRARILAAVAVRPRRVDDLVALLRLARPVVQFSASVLEHAGLVAGHDDTADPLVTLLAGIEDVDFETLLSVPPPMFEVAGHRHVLKVLDPGLPPSPFSLLDVAERAGLSTATTGIAVRALDANGALAYDRVRGRIIASPWLEPWLLALEALADALPCD